MTVAVKTKLNRLFGPHKEQEVSVEIHSGCVIFNYKTRGKSRCLDFRIQDARRLARLILAEAETEKEGIV